MSMFRSTPLAVAAFMILVASLVLATLTPIAGAPPSADVRVINTSAEPVPVAGTVLAQQSGSWTVGVSGMPTVLLGNPATDPVLTRSVDEPATQPFQTQVEIVIPHTGSSEFDQVSFPGGKRLVIEFISVNGNVLQGRALLVQVLIGDVTHEIALNDPRQLGNDIYTASQPVRLYADDNTGLQVRATHSAAPSEPAKNSDVSVSISGYLVDMP